MLFLDDFQPLSQQVVGLEDREIVATPTGGRCNQAVKAEECERRADLLRPALVAFTVTCHVDAQFFEADARKAQPNRSATSTLS